MEIDSGDLCAPLKAKSVDTIATDDVLAVLKPIWQVKPETASRLRGRIEKVLDAAKAKGFRRARTRHGGAAIWTTCYQDDRNWREVIRRNGL